jgi:hypothetical protein
MRDRVVRAEADRNETGSVERKHASRVDARLHLAVELAVERAEGRILDDDGMAPIFWLSQVLLEDERYALDPSSVRVLDTDGASGASVLRTARFIRARDEGLFSKRLPGGSVLCWCFERRGFRAFVDFRRLRGLRRRSGVRLARLRASESSERENEGEKGGDSMSHGEMRRLGDALLNSSPPVGVGDGAYAVPNHVDCRVAVEVANGGQVGATDGVTRRAVVSDAVGSEPPNVVGDRAGRVVENVGGAVSVEIGGVRAVTRADGGRDRLRNGRERLTAGVTPNRTTRDSRSEPENFGFPVRVEVARHRGVVGAVEGLCLARERRRRAIRRLTILVLLRPPDLVGDRTRTVPEDVSAVVAVEVSDERLITRPVLRYVPDVGGCAEVGARRLTPPNSILARTGDVPENARALVSVEVADEGNAVVVGDRDGDDVVSLVVLAVPDAVASSRRTLEENVLSAVSVELRSWLDNRDYATV